MSYPRNPCQILCHEAFPLISSKNYTGLSLDRHVWILAAFSSLVLRFSLLCFSAVTNLNIKTMYILTYIINLGFTWCSFSNSVRCEVRLLIWDFSCFLRLAWIAMNFLLRTAFTVSHRFVLIVFSFLFVLRYLLIPYLILLLTLCLLFTILRETVFLLF